MVKVSGVKSGPPTVLSGIPKGNVLGKIHFVKYINDLPEVAKYDTYIFADDNKTLLQTSTKKDALQLQSDRNSLKEWSHKWLLTFHPKMCHWKIFNPH